MAETLTEGQMASDSGAPLPSEPGMVELVADRQLPPLHGMALSLKGTKVSLHIIGGMKVSGKLAHVPEDEGWCSVVQGEYAYHIDLGAVAVLEELPR